MIRQNYATKIDQVYQWYMMGWITPGEGLRLLDEYDARLRTLVSAQKKMYEALEGGELI